MTKPYLFQKEDTNRLAFKYKKPGRGILGWHPGLGKTYGALRTAKLLKVKRAILVLCPAIAKENWKRECMKHFHRPAIVLYGRRPRLIKPGRKIVVANYDILGVPLRSSPMATWTEWLKRLDYEMIIFDEIQYLSNPTAKRSQAAAVLAEKTRYRIGLSGTPVESRVSQLWHIVSLVRPDMFPSKWWYEFTFCGGHRGKFGNDDVSGGTNLKSLHKIITHPVNGVLLRRRKEDVIDDLPPKRNIIHPFELTAAQRKEYEYARKHFLKWLYKQDAGKAVRASNAEFWQKLGYLTRLTSEFKQKSVIDWIEDFLESGQKLLLFGVHHKMLTPIWEKFRKRAVILTGKTRSKDRMNIVDKFNTHKKTDLMVANIDAGGVAWSCTGASNVAFCELSYIPAKHVQAADRAHGISRGIKGMPLNIYWLIAADTIEERQCKILQRKTNTISRLVDGMKAPKEHQILDLVIEAIRKEAKDERKAISRT